MGSLLATSHAPCLHLSFETHVPLLGSVEVPPAAPAAWVLPAGHYTDFGALSGAVAVALAVATGAPVAAAVLGYGEQGVSFTFPVLTAVAFPPAVAAHLGLAAAAGAPALTLASVNPPGGGWWPSLPITDADVTYHYERHTVTTAGGDRVTALVSANKMFRGTWHYTLADSTALAGVTHPILRGRRCRVWVDRSNAAAWAELNRTGYLNLVCEQTTYQAELLASTWEGTRTWAPRWWVVG